MGKDKLKHFLAGFSIAILGGVLATPFIGFLLAILAGLAKDVLHDLLLKKGYFEWLDILATTLGGALGFLLTSLLL